MRRYRAPVRWPVDCILHDARPENQDHLRAQGNAEGGFAL